MKDALMFGFKINKEKRYILIAGTALLLLGLIYRFSPGLDFFYSSQEEILLKKKKLFKYRQLVQEKNVFEKKLISLNRTLDRAESALLKGKTSALAAVELQNILKKMTGESQVGIKTMRVLKPEETEKEKYLGILVQFTFASTTRQLKEILYKIETSAKLLAIRELRIRNFRRRQAGQIQTTIVAEGFMIKGDK
ncbi:MAG: hypothetical protein DRH24_02825 [Deltaproteobacteria bacterium]|nr:MAG: hypothetical protein DRH24_02825 [Deltaproteobacteria bacterium]